MALEHGSDLVYAVDVGHHQSGGADLFDPRVRVREGLNRAISASPIWTVNPST